ncbi:hypothetical protein NMY22_g10289 [Coprinellus aureogranulatus]|nr:hypothetical protein NMY22_g10289 [Coprinellus aureogranulatus]
MTAESIGSESPFSRHLGTNFIPSFQDKTHIKELITNRECVAGSLDEEIARAEETLRTLKERRTVHTRYIQEHTALLSPVRQLSEDILADIFISCLSSTEPPATPGTPPDKKPHPAVVLSHVCRQWRQLAIRTKLLWTHLDIVIPEYPLTPRRFYRGQASESKVLADELPDEVATLYRKSVDEWEAKVERIVHKSKVWIDRAAPCALTVRFKSPLQMMGLPPLLDDGVENVRFQLFLSKSTNEHLLRLINRAPQEVPLLESVTLFVQDSERRPKVPEPVANSGLIKSDSLTSLILPVTLNSIATLPIDWEKLTNLSIGASDSHSPFDPTMAFPVAAQPFTKVQALTILKQCPNLVHCSLIVQSVGSAVSSIGQPDLPTSETEWIPGEVISLPELRSMSIRAASKALIDFPPHLDLPCIRKLDIGCSNFRAEDESTSGLALWLTTFGAHLEDVTFNYGCLTQEAFVNCLEHIPNVTNFTLTAVTKVHGYVRTVAQSALFKNSLLRDFIPKGQGETNGKGKGIDQDCLVPKLQRFHCRLGHIGEFDEHAWLDFLTARRSLPDASSRLKEASIRFYLPKTMDFRSELIKRNVDVSDFVLKTENPPTPTFSFEMPRQYMLDESMFQFEDWYHADGPVDFAEFMDGQPAWDATDESDLDDMDDGMVMDNGVDFGFAFGPMPFPPPPLVVAAGPVQT